METLITIFNKILYQPLFNALILFYQYLPVHDFGIAVIILTVLIRILFYPLMFQSIESQKKLAELQVKIQKIQNKYKDDKEKQIKETMALYQKEKINPFGGCLSILIQFPILIALYQVFQKGFRPEEMANLYNFVSYPGSINPSFLGIINLAKPNLILAFLAGFTQFFQVKMATPKSQKMKKRDSVSQFSEIIQKQTLYFFPIFTILILLKLPSAISLYLVITNLFLIGQQYLIFKKPAYAQSK